MDFMQEVNHQLRGISSKDLYLKGSLKKVSINFDFSKISFFFKKLLFKVIHSLRNRGVFVPRYAGSFFLR